MKTRLLIFFATTFILGGLYGASLDLIHVNFGVLYYANPFIFDQAWWVAPQFGIAFLALIIFSFLAQKKNFTKIPIKKEIALFILSLLGFTSVYLLSGVLKDYTTLLIIIFSAIWLIRFLFIKEKYYVLLLSIVLSVVGPLYEFILLKSGVFTYSGNNLLKFPIWLPLLYANGAYAAYLLGKLCVHSYRKAN